MLYQPARSPDSDVITRNIARLHEKSFVHKCEVGFWSGSWTCFGRCSEIRGRPRSGSGRRGGTRPQRRTPRLLAFPVVVRLFRRPPPFWKRPFPSPPAFPPTSSI